MVDSLLPFANLPPEPPDTPSTILAHCEVYREHLAKSVRELGRGARGVRIDTRADRLAFLRGQLGNAYLLPTLEPLWTAAQALNLGDVPPWPGEPQTGREAFEALDTLASWCRLKAANPHRVSINDRMLETMSANPESRGWSCKQWASHLKCAKSSVTETQAWKSLSTGRERERAERAQDRRRRPKGSDRRRG